MRLDGTATIALGSNTIGGSFSAENFDDAYHGSIEAAGEAMGCTWAVSGNFVAQDRSNI